MLGDQARVDTVGLQDAEGLLDDGADHRGLRIGHEWFHFGCGRVGGCRERGQLVDRTVSVTV
ncbi:hypothetical protein GCM10010519_34960 [Streptomyces lactacystinicus]